MPDNNTKVTGGPTNLPLIPTVMTKQTTITFAQMICNYRISYIQVTKSKTLTWDYQVYNRPFKQFLRMLKSMISNPKIHRIQISNMTTIKQYL